MEKYYEFNRNNLLLLPTDQRLKYKTRKSEVKTTVHWGQRKLALALIEFLTLYWDIRKVSEPKVVYAGAAPGINIEIVSDLFPLIKFHLYDPSPILATPRNNIIIYTGNNGLFTNDVAKR